MKQLSSFFKLLILSLSFVLLEGSSLAVDLPTNSVGVPPVYPLVARFLVAIDFHKDVSDRLAISETMLRSQVQAQERLLEKIKPMIDWMPLLERQQLQSVSRGWIAFRKSFESLDLNAVAVPIFAIFSGADLNAIRNLATGNPSIAGYLEIYNSQLDKLRRQILKITLLDEELSRYLQVHMIADHYSNRMLVEANNSLSNILAKLEGRWGECQKQVSADTGWLERNKNAFNALPGWSEEIQDLFQGQEQPSLGFLPVVSNFQTPNQKYHALTQRIKRILKALPSAERWTNLYSRLVVRGSSRLGLWHRGRVHSAQALAVPKFDLGPSAVSVQGPASNQVVERSLNEESAERSRSVPLDTSTPTIFLTEDRHDSPPATDFLSSCSEISSLSSMSPFLSDTVSDTASDMANSETSSPPKNIKKRKRNSID